MSAILDPLRATGEVRWSAAVSVDGEVVDALGSDHVVPTASIAKVFLLIVVAEQIAAGRLDPATVLAPRPDLAVADSGLLQHLADRRMCVDDLAALVGATSDNLATNVLVDRIGLDAVNACADALGATGCRLHDIVRDVRRAGIDPPQLSSGNAAQLLAVVERLADAAPGTAHAAVRGWLRLNTDLSMVAAAFDLDPLAHVGADLGVRLFNKTGTNDDVRADIGVLAGERRVAYAVLAHLPGAGARSAARRRMVLDAMRAVGVQIAALAGRTGSALS